MGFGGENGIAKWCFWKICAVLARFSVQFESGRGRFGARNTAKEVKFDVKWVQNGEKWPDVGRGGCCLPRGGQGPVCMGVGMGSRVAGTCCMDSGAVVLCFRAQLGVRVGPVGGSAGDRHAFKGL